MMRCLTLIGALIFALAGAGVSVALYLDINASAVIIARSAEEVAAVSARDAFAKTAATFVAETATEQAAAALFVTGSDDTAGAIELIEEAGNTARVDASVTAATIAPTDSVHHERLDVVVTARGSFVALGRFASILESLPRAAYVRSASLEAEDGGWLGTYIVSFVKRKAL